MASKIGQIGIYLFLLLALPPFFVGLINKTKALFAGKKGPPLLQLYFDLFKLFRKKSVLSKTTTPLFRWSPIFIFTALITSGLILPLWGTPMIHFKGDILLFAALLAFTRFFIILAAMDVGSSFEGMGTSREAFFGALAEIAFFSSLIVLVMTSHSISFQEIFYWELGHSTLNPSLFLVFMAFFLVLLTENSRMPMDDPNTHLELTMIHEVMILDYSGPELGLILYGASLKLFIFMILAAMILWPQPIQANLEAFALLLLKGGGMAIVIGIIESVTARVRLKKIPGLLLANFVVVVLALLVTLLGKEN